MPGIKYTYAERTVKKYTVGDAIDDAAKQYRGDICLDCIKRRSRDEAITLEERNDIAHNIVNDSTYWAGGYHGVN